MGLESAAPLADCSHPRSPTPLSLGLGRGLSTHLPASHSSSAPWHLWAPTWLPSPSNFPPSASTLAMPIPLRSRCSMGLTYGCTPPIITPPPAPDQLVHTHSFPCSLPEAASTSSPGLSWEPQACSRLDVPRRRQPQMLSTLFTILPTKASVRLLPPRALHPDAAAPPSSPCPILHSPSAASNSDISLTYWV